MDVVKYNYLNSLEMKQIESCGSTSELFLIKDQLYKLFHSFFVNHYGEDLYKKFNAIENIHIDNVIMPKKAIMQNDIFLGYTMEYYSTYSNLNDYFSHDRYVDVNDILNATKKASLILKDFHSKGILLRDYSFDNILIGNNNDIKVCDIDSCLYKEYRGIPVIPDFMKYYYQKVVHQMNCLDENFDRQTLLFAMLKAIYFYAVFDIKKYDSLANKIKVLKEIRPIFESLLNNSKTDVPYLDDIICEDEDFTIDRNKQKIKYFVDK